MSAEHGKDRLYAQPLPAVDRFTFDEAVADVFNDMIRRSVPGYATTIETIGVLAGRFAQAGSHCYDLGCSLGLATLAMRHGIDQPDCRIIAVDNAPAMVKRCRAAVERDRARLPVEVVEADLVDVPIENASVVVMNFTLQFVPPDRRQGVVDRIAGGLRPGGVFILSEKIRFDDPQEEALQAELHHRFKRANGYSDLEIAQKRQALESVLVRDRLDDHRRRMAAAGLGPLQVWFRCFNFVSMLALRDR